MREGHIHAWNDYPLMGYDALALPYMYPTVLTWLSSVLCDWFGFEKLFIISGYVSTAFLGFSGLFMYWLLKDLVRDGAIALVGAITYQFSTGSLLNVSSGDNSFLILMLIPLLTLAVRRFDSRHQVRAFIVMTFLIWLLLDASMLQITSYGLIFVGSYLAYRATVQRDWRLMSVLISAFLVAFLLTYPRFSGLFEVVQQYNRKSADFFSTSWKNFDYFYVYQQVFPSDFLRWFDDKIFGRYPSEAAGQNHLNSIEGMLLYSSVWVPLLFILGSVRYRSKTFYLGYASERDARFLFWFFVIALLFLLCKPLLYLLYLAYQKMSFFHVRMILILSIPLTMLLAIILADIKEKLIGVRAKPMDMIQVLAPGVMAAVAAFGIEILSKHQEGFVFWEYGRIPGVPPGFADYLLKESIMRIVLSAGLFLVWAIGMFSKFNSNSPEFKRGGYLFLCYFISIQTVLGAYLQVNDIHSFQKGYGFEYGDLYYAKRNEFLLPDPTVVNSLRGLLENDEYRLILFCDRRSTNRWCSGHVPGFWHLRTVDGYYGFGLPKRYQMLPWMGHNDIRTIDFTTERKNTVPWGLLGMLSVKYAIEVSPELYTNAAPDPKNPLSVLQGIKWSRNPELVFPRAFFVKTVGAVRNQEEAFHFLFEKEGREWILDRSFVEGLMTPEVFPTEGKITVSGRGDRISVSFEPSQQARFLVLNDLFFKGWTARTDNQALTIYPTNLITRGVRVPAGAREVIFEYETPSRMWHNRLVQGLGGVLFVLGIIGFRAREKRTSHA